MSRIQRIRRPRRDELVVGLEQRLRRRAHELRDPAADDDPLDLDSRLVGELGAQRGGVRVEVAVQSAARGVRDRVDHLGGRVLGPGRPRQVERLDARELPRPARRPPPRAAAR